MIASVSAYVPGSWNVTAGAAPVTVDVTLVWEVLSRTDTGLSAMVHLTLPNGTGVADGDGAPLGGSYPTTLWRTGEVVLDTHRVALPTGVLPEGDLLAETNRLPVVDQQDVLPLGRELSDHEPDRVRAHVDTRHAERKPQVGAGLRHLESSLNRPGRP